MASYTWREVVSRSVEYAVPSGGAVAEFNKAFLAAREDFLARNGYDSNTELWDDWARVYARDDEVVIVFDVKQPS
jgi:hypothetical protein